MAPAAAIFTVGYERATPPALLAALRGAGVRRVVDVRALANSRRPGFAKRALSAALDEAGIGYLHLPALGTPAEGREAVRAGRPEEMKRIFARRLAGTDAAVVMKLGRNLSKVRRAVEAAGLTARAIYVARGTMAGEEVVPLADKPDDEAPYFSMVLVPGQGRRL